MRKTASLQAIRAYLGNKSTAVSAVELVDHFSERFNKTTIYRVLTRLEHEGEVHSVLGNDATMYYAMCHSKCSKEAHHDQHVHRQCRSCGEVSCVEVAIPALEAMDFQVEEAKVLLIGLCKNCQ